MNLQDRKRLNEIKYGEIAKEEPAEKEIVFSKIEHMPQRLKQSIAMNEPLDYGDAREEEEYEGNMNFLGYDSPDEGPSDNHDYGDYSDMGREHLWLVKNNNSSAKYKTKEGIFNAIAARGYYVIHSSAHDDNSAEAGPFKMPEMAKKWYMKNYGYIK